MDLTPASWDPEAKTFSFFLHKRGCESLLCIVAMDALENAAQSSDLSEPALTRIFDAHRQLIELRAAQKLNAGLLESDGSVLVTANDIWFGADRQLVVLVLEHRGKFPKRPRLHTQSPSVGCIPLTIGSVFNSLTIACQWRIGQQFQQPSLHFGQRKRDRTQYALPIQCR
jgi:Protein of unknown function (DUF1488)